MSLWGQHCPCLGMNASYDLSVSFRGWKNIPPTSDARLAALHARYGLTGFSLLSGECALLEIANNDTRELRLDTLAIEYKAEGNWQRVVPKNWPWPSSSSWSPGTSTTFPFPRPAEVPRDAPWRIQFLCCAEGETDDRHKARMETPEIPPIGRPSE